MNMIFHKIARGAWLLAFAAAGFCGSAATLEEARVLAEDGNLEEAIAMLRELEEATPKDASVSLQLGAYYQATGRDADAMDAYTSARRKGSREAILALAELANQQYRVDDARTLVEEYRKTLKKGKRTLAPDESGDIDDRIDRTENMLSRVEQIEVIDSLVVDADSFFEHYRLTPESGSINSPEVLPQGFEAAEPTVVYEPESRRQMIWAAPDTAGNYRLMSSSALYGGSWEQPSPLGDMLAEGGDANYPFLMPDGITLYYANDGENSLGGLDIFISRRSDEEFLQPQNLGMPYNSPYDDYMLAIDELTGVGWWATDRNRIPGKVTIYLFVPQELRRNVDPDSPDLLTRARLSSIRDTWREGTDREGLLRQVAAIRPSGTPAPEKLFELYVPGRGIYTNYDDFRSRAAREAMHDCLEGEGKLASAEALLAKAREAYGRGDRSQADFINRVEAQLDGARNEVTELRNRVIELELQ